MDNSALSKLNEEQLSVLDDDLKAVFCTLDEYDQDFFAKNYKAKDLPTILARKREIMQRNQGERERIAKLKEAFAKNAPPTTDGKSEDILAGVAGALGIGAAAAVVASDNTAFYQGVKPYELVPALSSEFETARTSVATAGNPDTLTVTVSLLTGRAPVAAMTVNLTALKNGTEVKVNDLTAQGVLEAIKSGGQKLFDLAGKGIELLVRRDRISPMDLYQAADRTLDSGADLAETLQQLKLKERAWKVIRQTAEAIEASYRDRVEKERQERFQLEQAWSRYTNCPNCSVAFGAEDMECRVCGAARPEKPQKGLE